MESVICVILGYGGYLVYKGEFNAGQLMEFIGYFNAVIWPIMAIAELIDMTSRGKASLQRISELLDAPKNVYDRPDVKALENPKGDIAFRDLSFTYPDGEFPALEHISFEIKPGESIGLVGKTGSGKTTLVDLILRTYNVPDGTLFLDGQDVNSLSIRSVRDACAYVPQDNFLFSDTIGGNISFGVGEQREYDEQYIRRMATIAGADGFIRSMPEGYDTVVGERGVGLSGGQKQRLSLARALADNPSILIMDDTTSAVDMETEAEIQRHLRELDERKTIVTIAHRISSVKDSDLILVLEHGRIVERGTHDELVAAHGRYWEIYYKQLGLQAGRSHGFEA